MSGTIRPSSSMCEFHSVIGPSSSLGSWPRSSSRTGLSESSETRYWYQEMSQATVTTISALTPESDDDRDLRRAERLADAADRAPVLGRVEDVGRLDHRQLVLRETPQDRLRRDRLLGPRGRVPRSADEEAPRRRRVGRDRRRRRRPLSTQPYSTAVSGHSGQTST